MIRITPPDFRKPLVAEAIRRYLAMRTDANLATATALMRRYYRRYEPIRVGGWCWLIDHADELLKYRAAEPPPPRIRNR